MDCVRIRGANERLATVVPQGIYPIYFPISTKITEASAKLKRARRNTLGT
jgi:hypothetical protein